MPLSYTRTLDGCLRLDISDDSSWGDFERVAGQIVKRFDGGVVARSDDPDQRRWGITIKGTLVRLHLEQGRSLQLFSTDSNSDDVVKSVGQFLAMILPTAKQRE